MLLKNWYPAVLSLGLLVVGCTPPASEQVQGTPANYNAFSATLPSWQQFSPLKESEDKPTGPTSAPVRVVEEGVQYTCQTTPMTLTQNPEDIVTLDPDSNVLWVGALLQGKGYKQGIGSLRELPIRARAPLELSIDLLTSNNTKTVANPNLATVQQAIGELIEATSKSGAKVGSSIDFSQVSTYSLEQSLLELGLSGKYLSAKASNKLKTTRKANQSTITAYFVQKMFTVSMVLPETPNKMFSEGFTQAMLDEQKALGNIGSDNIPTYVANVVYGRVLMFTMTSRATESTLRNVLNASYSALVAGGSVNLTLEQRRILQESEINVVAIGGEGDNALAVIRSGDLRAYFSKDPPITTAKPISYSVRNLGDNSIATVSETTNYNLQTCTSLPPTARKVGEEIRVTLDRIVLHHACDPGRGEIYGRMDINGVRVWSLPETSYRDGSSITISKSDTRVYRLGSNERIRIEGRILDADGLLNEDDLAGNWNLSLDPFTPSTLGAKQVYYRKDGGCDSTLFYRVDKIRDVFEQP